MRKVKTTIDGRSHRDVVEEAAVDADDRNGAEVAAAMNRMAQHVRPVGTHEGRDLDAVEDGIGARRGLGLGAHGIDAGIGAPAAGQVLNSIDIVFHEVDRLRPGVARELQPFGHRVDRDHPRRPQQECAADGELADWTAAPNREIVSSGWMLQKSAAM
jgi:hypothetical protein